MNKRLAFAIVGCGRIAKRHAALIERFGKLVAVCDVNETAANCFANQYQVPAFYSLQQMLSAEIELDVVVVCTPNGLHATHSIEALKAGKHVLCEKPMAIAVNDCLDMIDAANYANKHLFVVKQNRYNPPVTAVKQLLENRSLGKLYSFQLNCFWNRSEAYYANSWKGTMALDGGTLFTQFSHFIDLLYWYFGEVKTISAFTHNYGHQGIIEFEDTGMAILQFESGLSGAINYTVNAHDKNMEGSLTIFAEKGTVKIGGQYLNTLEYQNIENLHLENLPESQLPNDYGTYQGSMSNHDRVYENVLAVLNEHAQMDTTMFEAMKTVEIISRIYKAANN